MSRKHLCESGSHHASNRVQQGSAPPTSHHVTSQASHNIVASFRATAAAGGCGKAVVITSHPSNKRSTAHWCELEATCTVTHRTCTTATAKQPPLTSTHQRSTPTCTDAHWTPRPTNLPKVNGPHRHAVRLDAAVTPLTEPPRGFLRQFMTNC
jgi:hypothetical protein